jgi:hypothetical protein
LATKKNLEIVRKLYEENPNLLVNAVAKKLRHRIQLYAQLRFKNSELKNIAKYRHQFIEETKKNGQK